jgi:hypothetical protein
MKFLIMHFSPFNVWATSAESSDRTEGIVD